MLSKIFGTTLVIVVVCLGVVAAQPVAGTTEASDPLYNYGGGSISEAEAPGLPNPLTVSFSASINAAGASYPFNVVPNATFGSMGKQFSRDPVNITSNVSACFYNISTASGSISGDLNGDIELRWNRLEFEDPYPDAEEWFVDNPDGFALLYIKGNFTSDELGAFDFVAVGDLDYKGTNTKGAGSMVTVIPWEAPPPNPPDDVLIGEISSYTLSGTTISGTFSLRHYSRAAGEVADSYALVTLAGVLGDDEVDNVTTESVSLIQFTRDDIATNRTVGMEEMNCLREVPLNITGGYLGVGGNITLERTGIMDYVMIGPDGVHAPEQGVHATTTVEDNWASNKTNMRGKSYGIVVADMVNFTIWGPDQQAYVWMPGYSEGYEGEGYSKGMESFLIADTHINFSFAISRDSYTFHLMPTPVVSSVCPNAGKAGDNLAVTINGKWFLTNETYHPLTIDFGPDVTVNSHEVVSDTQINATISIDGGASIGVSDVSVTKMNLTGTLTDGFGIGECNLTVNVTPGGGGNVTVNGTTPSDYPNSTTWDCGENVALNAVAAGGYSFVNWSGNLCGNVNPKNITMDGNKTITANFVVFTAPANVDVTAADPGIESIDVSSVEFSEVNTTNMPEDIEAQEAYVVNSTGTGNFTLSFTSIANAESIVVYKVTDSDWVQLASAGSGTTLEVTIPAGDPPVVFCTPTGAPPPVGGTVYLVNKLAILAPWIALAVLLAGGLSWLTLRRRRAQS